jgi:quercetin dioxygenase-like cupin family protein
MVTKSKSTAINSLLFLFLFACAPSPRFFLQYGGELKDTELNKILADNPLLAAENIKVTTLGQGDAVSHHVVQVRNREIPHIHKEHDLTVAVMRGRGYLMLEKTRINLSVGDFLFIPRGTIHYFVNTFHEPSVALAIFSPPFDGKDAVPVGPR